MARTDYLKRYRETVGVGERGQDFHALRHTFTNMMEGAGVAVPTIQLLIGHSRKQTMGTTAISWEGVSHSCVPYRFCITNS